MNTNSLRRFVVPALATTLCLGFASRSVAQTHSDVTTVGGIAGGLSSVAVTIFTWGFGAPLQASILIHTGVAWGVTRGGTDGGVGLYVPRTDVSVIESIVEPTMPTITSDNLISTAANANDLLDAFASSIGTLRALNVSLDRLYSAMASSDNVNAEAQRDHITATLIPTLEDAAEQAAAAVQAILDDGFSTSLSITDAQLAAGLAGFRATGLPRVEMPVLQGMDMTPCEFANITHLLWDVDAYSQSSYTLDADCLENIVTLMDYTVAIVQGIDLDPASVSPTWWPCLETIAPFGCGVNPAASMQYLSGVPSIGTSFTLGIHNPLATQANGSSTFLIASAGHDAAFPCGASTSGFGMGTSGVGEILIDTNAILWTLQGGNWSGSPVSHVVSLPNNSSLVGTKFYFQGMIVDGSTSATNPIAVTDAVELLVGW